MKEMNVLITGAASGIGKAVAEYFRGMGATVFSLDIKASDSPGITSFVADITNGDSLAAVKSALTESGTKLDVILNIAGVHAMASFVESDYKTMERVININLLGTMQTNRVFHSLLKQDGRIIIVTSEVATYTPMPFNGLYNVSKTALECYADSLRQELNLLGQKVITIHPGAVETPLANGSLGATEKLAEDTVLYAEEAKHFANIVRKFTGTPMKPEKLAKLIYKAATAKRPRFSYDKHRSAGLVLLNMLPKSWQCGIIKMLLKHK